MEHSIASTGADAAGCADAEIIASALARGEFEFHYQPLYSVPGRRIVGYEALARWVRPGEDVVHPGAFIDVVTAPPLSRKFDANAVEEGIRTARRFHREGRRGVTISVNVSAETLTHPGFVDVVCARLAEAELPPGALTIEILESTRPDAAAMASALIRLRSVGVRIALDDFGSGYANLDVLLALPLDIVKLDRGLIASGPAALPVLEAITSLSHRLGLVVVVEGIETPEQWDLVVGVGADMAQGYLLGSPTSLVG